MTKIAPIGGDSLVASSGSLALGQKIRMVFETHHAEFRGPPLLRSSALAGAGDPRRRHPPRSRWPKRPGTSSPGPRATRWPARWRAIPFADGLRLCHVDYDGSIYCLNENLPYVTAGSGKINADPFIRFIWDVFWPEPGHLPPLREAIFAAYWTVQMNIEYQSTGVGIGGGRVDARAQRRRRPCRRGNGLGAARALGHVHRDHEAGHARANATAPSATRELRSRRHRSCKGDSCVMRRPCDSS